jgi:hypothetical protein
MRVHAVDLTAKLHDIRDSRLDFLALYHSTNYGVAQQTAREIRERVPTGSSIRVFARMAGSARPCSVPAFCRTADRNAISATSEMAGKNLHGL